MKLAVTLHLFVCASKAIVYRPDSDSHNPCDTVDEGFICNPEKARFWGNKTPFFSMGSKESRKKPPDCKVDQVSYLGRHGARGSNTKDTETLRQVLELKVAPNILQKFPFLEDEVFKNPGMVLMPLGKQQAYHAGIRLAKDYPQLAASSTPMVRTSPSSRVKDTVLYLMQGFEDVREEFEGAKYVVWRQEDLKVVPDLLEYAFAERLVFKPGSEQRMKAYNRRAELLQNTIVQNALGITIPTRFKTARTINLFADLCIVDTFALTSQKSIGAWCELLSPEFFRETVDYPLSIHSWYAGGPGHPHVTTRAIAWVKELGARLLDKETGIFTLGPDSAPLNEKIYVDGTHREVQEPILVALGLFDSLKPPSLDRYTPPEETDGWSYSGITSLGGRLIVERLQCDGWDGPFVRFILQDGVREIAKLSDLRTPGPGIYPVEKGLDNVEQILEQARINLTQDPPQTEYSDSEDDDDDDENSDTAFVRVDETPVERSDSVVEEAGETQSEKAGNSPLENTGDAPS